MRSSPDIEAGAGFWRAAARVVFWASVGLLTAAYCLLLPALLLPRTWVLVAVMVTVALPAATALPSVGE